MEHGFDANLQRNVQFCYCCFIFYTYIIESLLLVMSILSNKVFSLENGKQINSIYKRRAEGKLSTLLIEVTYYIRILFTI